MLKNIARLSVVAAVLMSSSTMAASFGSADASTTATITTNNCTALSNNVKVQLSKGVFADYACSPTTVNAGTCHANGTFKEQTVGCSYQPTFDSSGIPTGSTPSDPSCPAWDGNGSAPTGNTGTFSGRLAFMGSSGGGTVGSFNLLNRTCTAQAIDDLVI